MAVDKLYDDKKQRAYIFRFGYSQTEYKEVKYPLTCEFSITRNHLASANQAEFTIYNLNSVSRNQIIHDPWDTATRRGIEFYAGYTGGKDNVQLPLCFKGIAREAFSQRQGSEWKTMIRSDDGALSFEVEDVSLTVEKNVPERQIMQNLIGEFTSNVKATIGAGFGMTKKRASALFGNPIEIMKDLSKNQMHIDSGNVYILDKNETINGDVRKISAENGLIGTPRYYEKKVEVEMIFEPRLKPAQLIELESTGANRFNGVYKITGIQHSGVISESISAECTTKVTMMRVPDARIVPDGSPNVYRVYGQDPFNLGI